MAKSLVVFSSLENNKVTNYHDVSDNDNYITFNSDETGTGKQISGTGADGCVGKSLEGLYKEGHAFNFNRIEKPSDSCVLSNDNRCGRLFDFKTCPGNQFCSKLFWCGDSDDHKNSQDPEFSSGITNPQCPQQITKFDGWPDVILCDIYYHYFNKFDNEFIMYSTSRWGNQESNIIFKLDGEIEQIDTNSWWLNYECTGKSIEW